VFDGMRDIRGRSCKEHERGRPAEANPTVLTCKKGWDEATSSSAQSGGPPRRIVG